MYFDLWPQIFLYTLWHLWVVINQTRPNEFGSLNTRKSNSNMLEQYSATNGQKGHIRLVKGYTTWYIFYSIKNNWYIFLIWTDLDTFCENFCSWTLYASFLNTFRSFRGHFFPGGTFFQKQEKQSLFEDLRVHSRSKSFLLNFKGHLYLV